MDFNEKCFKFQQDFINFFNEQDLPFLLKYYLLNQVWEDILLNKKRLSSIKTSTKKIPITMQNQEKEQTTKQTTEQ